MKQYYQYYKYLPILQIFKYLKVVALEIGNPRRRRAGFTPHHNAPLVRTKLNDKTLREVPQGPDRKVMGEGFTHAPNHGAGFTLLELLLYIGIFSILLMVFVQFFTSILDVGQESAAISSVNQDSQFILDRLSYDIHRAQSVTTPGALGEISNSLQIVIDGINYTYSVSDGNLLLSNDSGINMLNGFDTAISNVTFRKIGNIGGKDTLVVGFTLTSKALRKGGAEVKNFQTAIGTR